MRKQLGPMGVSVLKRDGVNSCQTPNLAKVANRVCDGALRAQGVAFSVCFCSISVGVCVAYVAKMCLFRSSVKLATNPETCIIFCKSCVFTFCGPKG